MRLRIADNCRLSAPQCSVCICLVAPTQTIWCGVPARDVIVFIFSSFAVFVFAFLRMISLQIRFRVCVGVCVFAEALKTATARSARYRETPTHTPAQAKGGAAGRWQQLCTEAHRLRRQAALEWKSCNDVGRVV